MLDVRISGELSPSSIFFTAYAAHAGTGHLSDIKESES